MSVIQNIRPQPKAELRHVRMLIDGSWVDSLSGVTLTVENPAKRKSIATIPRGAAADVTVNLNTPHRP
jgi:acyl-CoA reductase-like NAD-dependent aldehyde dehydrogenase